VVERQAEAARDAAEAAAERETADARMRDGAGRRDEAVRHGLVVEIAEQAAARDVRDARGGVDAHAAQEREIDQQAVVAGRVARRAVPAALHGDEQVRIAREVDGELDVGGAARLHDQRGALVHLPVQHAARDVVARVSRQHEVAAQRFAERLHVGARERDFGTVARDGTYVRLDARRGAQDRGPAARGGERRSRGGGQSITGKLTTSEHGVLLVSRWSRSCSAQAYTSITRLNNRIPLLLTC